MNEKRRLFFACWPDATVREKIVHATTDIIIPNGRRIQAENLHLTLSFIGDVTENMAECYASAAERVSTTPFSICLQSYGHFRKPKVFYMAVPEIPAPLSQLVSNLNAALVAHGYQPEQRAYCPHVSLYRKADLFPETELQKQPDIEWRIDRFYLVESIFGAGHAIYKPIQEYKFL